jgi:retron-type reverse transcriptase
VNAISSFGEPRKAQRSERIPAVKTYRNLYEKICDFETLHSAYLNARKNKRYRSEVLAFTANLEENLIEIQNELIHQTYAVGRYREFYVTEPKKRLVMALPFKDRVVQWALYMVINPIVTKGFIRDSYACITGRGTHRAVERLHYWLKLLGRSDEPAYYLKMDISKYFYSVDHEVLLGILARKFPDDRLLWLLRLIIESEDTPFGLTSGRDLSDAERLFDRGMPIGNLTSQLFANIYLNELDQYVKRELRARYYLRYMDDTIILSRDKSQLHAYRDLIDAFLHERLRLSLNAKTAIRPARLGILFCGYRIWPTHIKLGKRTALKMRHRLKSIQRQYAAGILDLDQVKRVLASYIGIMQHCDSLSLRRTIFGDPEIDAPGWFGLKLNTPDEAATD